MRFLLVEDEPLIAMMIEDYLDLLGHEVAKTVETAAAGLEACASGGFDAAIVDLHLRGGDQGSTVAKALMAGGVPFIIASGTDRVTDAGLADRPRLPKPFTLDELERAVASLG